MYQFYENIMQDGLYWENWYDVNMSPTGSPDRNILYENHLIGVPRMRQVRIARYPWANTLGNTFNKVFKKE